jgi:hypothetical protein
MRSWKFFILTALILGTTVYTGYAAALAPLLVTGSACSGGGTVWTVYEDRNGDGTFDYRTRHDCDGSITAGIFDNVTTPTHLCDFPTGIAVDYTLTTSLQSSGLYDWGLQAHRTSDNALVASVYRSGSTLACSIEEGFLQ